MTARSKSTPASPKESNENPLISNAKFRQIYTAIVEARLFDEHLAKLQRRAKSSRRMASIAGEEACRASVLIELRAGDFISDDAIHPVTELILGAEASPLLQRTLTYLRTGKRKALPAGDTAQQLSPVDDADERLRLALGAALTQKTAKKGNIVLAFVHPHRLKGSEWKKILVLAQRLELPILFVVLPGSKKHSDKRVCDRARAAGVPGIPVDAADAVALFRIVQESMGRTRNADGPVLVECMAYKLPGQPAVEDPLRHLKKFLLEKKIYDRAGLDAVAMAFRKRLGKI